MKATFKKCRLCGTLNAPPSKSYAHRMIIAAALSEGESLIRGISLSDDILATLDCIKSLGAEYELCGNDLRINGGIKSADKKTFHCRESGSTLRFFIPLSLAFGGESRFTGTPRLIERGADIYEKTLNDISFEKSDETIAVSGKLSPGNYKIPGNISSQYISGLLFALPLLNDSSTLEIKPPIESKSYIDITVDVLSKFGIVIEKTEENKFFIKGNQKYESRNVFVEGDWSNAAFFFALNSSGNNITIENLNKSSIQGDRICTELLKKLEEKEPVIDVSNCPDLAPVLFAVAGAKHGTVFAGTKRLKIKESDRANAMSEELSKFGITVKIEENAVTVYDNELKTPEEELDSHNDHRIAMALSVLLTLTGGTLNGIESVNKSYPGFFNELKKLGAKIIIKK